LFYISSPLSSSFWNCPNLKKINGHFKHRIPTSTKCQLRPNCDHDEDAPSTCHYFARGRQKQQQHDEDYLHYATAAAHHRRRQSSSYSIDIS
jgi:hypothetical protein